MFKVFITLTICIIFFTCFICFACIGIGTIAYLLGFEKSWAQAVKKVFKNF